MATSPYLLLVSASALLYTLYWSSLTIARFNALQAHILDLGATAEELWLPLHGGTSLSVYWELISIHGLAFVLSPLELFPSYSVLLIFQSAALASAGLAIYGIARKELRSRLASALIAESYFLFFPVSGMNWFDFHIEIFIVPLFLWGFYFYCHDRPWPAYVLFSLTALSQFPYGGYTALFALVNLASVFRFRSKRLLSLGNPRFVRFDIALLTISALTLLLGILYLNSVGESGALYFHLSPGTVVSGSSATITSDERLVTFLVLFAPFLFLPLLSPRWALFLVPGLLSILFSGDPSWVYPHLFFDQYPAVIVPFIYLGLIDFCGRGLITFGPVPPVPRDHPTLTKRRPVAFHRNHQSVMTAVVVLIAVGLLGTVYDPYGPFNSSNSLSYRLPGSITENATVDATLSKLISLIPAANPNILVQQNIPEIYPRPLGNNGHYLIAGVSIAYNFTYLYKNQWLPAKIDYVIADPWDYTFTYESLYPFNLSMESDLQILYQGGTFGIMGEANGLTLLGRNYSGPLEYYVPVDQRIPASSLLVTNPSYRDRSLISANNVTSGTVWFGPYSIFLPPGLYVVTYALRTTNNSSGNRLVFDVRGTNLTLINSTNLSGNEVSPKGSWVNIVTQVYLNNFEGDIDFSGDAVHWFGNLSLSGITIMETSAPSTRFLAGMGPPYTVLYQLKGLIPSGATIVAQPGLGPVLSGDRYTSATEFVWNESRRPQYLLGDPSWPGLFTIGNTNGQSMFTILQTGFDRQGYGVLAMVDGSVLLELGRTLPPSVFIPDNQTISPSDLSVVESGYRSDGLIEANNVTNQSTVWFGPFEYLPPGNYSASFRLLVSDLNSSSYMKQDILTGIPLRMIAELEITAANFGSSSQWTDVVVQFSLSSFSYNVDFSANDVDWQGLLALASISLVQLTS